MRQLYGIYMARVSGMASTVRDQVYAWTALGESETQEFKIRTGQRSEAAKTLCAFLNLKGGRILFGVDPTGSVVGQEVTDHTPAKVYREIEQFDPEIMPSIERVAIEGGREVVVLSTGHGRYKPYRYKGQPYRRVGTVTTVMGRQAEDFLRGHLRVTASIEQGIARVDEPEIPIVALREALANAISHREYATGAGSIFVNIFDDRVEVASVGPLHFGLSVADLYRPHESQPWNPLIAGTLYRRGIIDSLGSGTLRMLRVCRRCWLVRAGHSGLGNKRQGRISSCGCPSSSVPRAGSRRQFA